MTPTHQASMKETIKTIKNLQHSLKTKIQLIPRTYFNMRTWRICAKTKRHQITYIRNSFDTIVGTSGRRIIIPLASKES